MLQKTVRLNGLYDIYHPLLTPKQRDYLQFYYLEDYSLAEIAEYFQVSRQAVYDNIKRTESILENYEEKLQLYEKRKERLKTLDTLKEYLFTEKQNEHLETLIHQLYDLS